MALRSVMSSKMPIVIILGATGTGKTKLSLELAQKFNTELISADSMQIYKGLDVVTAKATRQERSLVPHHLLDILEPHQCFTVVDFRNRALSLIDNMILQEKLPIIVGGTNYYIESIVYKILVEDMDDTDSLLWDLSRRKRDFAETSDGQNTAPKKKVTDDKTKEGGSDANEAASTSRVEAEIEIKEEVKDDEVEAVTRESLKEDVDNEKNFTSEEIHAKLKAIDPAMAKRLHPNNRRKILRSIEVWLKSGRRHSEILAEQKLSEGQLRRPGATIILWLKCEQSIHDKRLDARVDAMLEEGLIQELLDFHERHNRQRIRDEQPPDYTKGVFQTLGFKEFHEYLMLPEEARNSEGGQKVLEISIENMKMATRRYARRQNKMVRGRFLNHPNREVPLIFELDTTDLAKWNEEVHDKSINIIENYLQEKPCNYQPLVSIMDPEQKKIDGNSSNYCEICERLILGDNTFKLHLKSIKHKKVLKKKNKAAASAECIPQVQ